MSEAYRSRRFSVDHVEVSKVDGPAGGLAEDADDVSSPGEVDDEHGGAGEAHPPEGGGDDGLSGLFADEPLDEHAAGEENLAGQPDADPEHAGPAGDVEQDQEPVVGAGLVAAVVEALDELVGGEPKLRPGTGDSDFDPAVLGLAGVELLEPHAEAAGAVEASCYITYSKKSTAIQKNHSNTFRPSCPAAPEEMLFVFRNVLRRPVSETSDANSR